jgi:hypothetical protein
MAHVKFSNLVWIALTVLLLGGAAIQNLLLVGTRTRPTTTVDILEERGETMRSEWWLKYVDSLARAYPSWPKTHSWCTCGEDDDSSQQQQHSGLLFVKSHKAASTTGSGITHQIARNVAERQDSISCSMCDHQYQHRFADRKGHGNRTSSTSFMWTNVRDPAATALSAFFFFSASRNEQPVTSENIIRTLERRKSRQTTYLLTQELTRPTIIKESDPDSLISFLQTHLYDQYNFMAVVERMDESLAVLQLILGLQDFDMIVLKAKQSGTWYMGGRQGGCVQLIPPFSTRTVAEFLATNFTRDNLDQLLHAVANRSLDLTIDVLGRAKVERLVQRHVKLQRLVQDKCWTVAKFPCSPNGTIQFDLAGEDCYTSDVGCGFKCVDRVAQEFKKRKLR